MDDQRTGAGTAFGLEDSLHRGGVECVRAQPIDRLCWKGDQPTCANECSRALDLLIADINSSRVRLSRLRLLLADLFFSKPGTFA